MKPNQQSTFLLYGKKATLPKNIILLVVVVSLLLAVDGFQLQQQQLFHQRIQEQVYGDISISSSQSSWSKCQSSCRRYQSSSIRWMIKRQQQIPMDDFTILDDDDDTNNNNDNDSFSSSSVSTTTASVSGPSKKTVSWMDRNTNFVSGNANDQQQQQYDGTNTKRRNMSTGSSSTSTSFDRGSGTGSFSSGNRSIRSPTGTNYGSTSTTSISTSKTFRQDFRGTRVFVQNIAKHTSWQTLKDHFRTIILNNMDENNNGDGTSRTKSSDNNNKNMNSIVIYSSISIDTITGMSKGHGIVQFETTDMAQYAIQNIRYYPLDGNVLYVRPDVQEGTVTTNQEQLWEQQQRYTTTRKPTIGNSVRGSTTSNVLGKWNCANDQSDIEAMMIDTDTYRSIEQMLQARDDARKRKNFVVSDNIREQLKIDHTVHLDDRLRMWWIDTSTSTSIGSITGTNNEFKSTVPKSIQELKGDGRWGKKVLDDWRQIPTTIENDSCVDNELVVALLQQRDIARREKDFKKADRLLEQARTSPSDNNLFLRIHDESRTFRIWTAEKPSPILLHGTTQQEQQQQPSRRTQPQREEQTDYYQVDNDTTDNMSSSRSRHRSNDNSYQKRFNDDNDDDDSFSIKSTSVKASSSSSSSSYSSSSSTQLSASEQCIELIQRMAPDKVIETQNLLSKFPGREYTILKKLKQRYEQQVPVE